MIIIESLINDLLENMFSFGDVCIKYALLDEWHDEKIKELFERVGQRQQDILFILINTNCNTTSAIGKELCLSKSSISLTVSKMVKNGLVEKCYADSENDSRFVTLKITDEGMRVYEGINDFFVSFVERNVTHLTGKEIEILNEGFKHVNIFSDIVSIPELKVKDVENIDVRKFLLGVSKFKFRVIASINKLGKNIHGNLNPNDFRVLDLIHNHGVNTPKDISNIILKSESAVSCHLSNLVKKKYLIREKKDDDIRKTYFYLTEKGMEEHKLMDNEIKNLTIENLKSMNDSLVSTLNQCLVCFISFFILLNEKERRHN